MTITVIPERVSHSVRSAFKSREKPNNQLWNKFDERNSLKCFLKDSVPISSYFSSLLMLDIHVIVGEKMTVYHTSISNSLLPLISYRLPQINSVIKS